MKNRKKSELVGFKPLKGTVIFGSRVRLREKRLSDVRRDYAWQSDPELSSLDAAPTLITPFSVYLLDYAVEIHRPRSNRYPLAVETLDGTHIGNCTCYDIDENKGEAQVGIMIGDRDYWDMGYGTDVVTTMVHYVFLTTSLNRLYLKTLDWNQRAQRCFEKCGFTQFGDMRRNGLHFVLMELRREQWQELHKPDKKESKSSV